MEIINDKKYYYDSKISMDYNKLTDDGMRAVLEYITIMAPHMIKNERELLDKRAKELVMEELKR